MKKYRLLVDVVWELFFLLLSTSVCVIYYKMVDLQGDSFQVEASVYAFYFLFVNFLFVIVNVRLTDFYVDIKTISAHRFAQYKVFLFAAQVAVTFGFHLCLLSERDFGFFGTLVLLAYCCIIILVYYLMLRKFSFLLDNS